MPKFQPRKLAEVALVAAAYTALGYIFAPVSFAVLQFRVAEIVKPLVLYRRHLVWSLPLGVALVNLASPYAGAWELLWMPAMNLVGGYLAWWLGQISNAYVGASFLAGWIALAVALMLTVVLHLPFWPVFFSLLVSESLLIVGGVPLMRWVSQKLPPE